MNELLRRLARSRGLDPGPDTEVSLEFADLPTGGLGLLVSVLVLALLWLVWRLGRNDASRVGRGGGALLSTLRVLSLLVLGLLLLDPRVVTRDRQTIPGRTLVLIDASQSMAAIDPYRDEEVSEQRSRLVENGVVQPDKISRLSIVTELLSEGRLRALAENNHVDVLQFGRDASLLRSIATGSSEVSMVWNDLVADRVATDPVRAIESALRGSDGGSSLGADEIAGLVVLSDGRRNQGPRLANVGGLLDNRGVARTVLIPIGDPSPERAIVLSRFDAPEGVFPNDPFEVEIEVRAVGFDGRTTTVELWGGPPEAENLERLDSREITVGTEPDLVTFQDLRLDGDAPIRLEARVRPFDGVEQTEGRHIRARRVDPIDSTTRVLLLSGGPTHEYRALRRAWSRDDSVEVACWLQSATPGFPQDGDRSLTDLPQGTELDEFDVYVLLDPDASKLPQSFVDRLVERVRNERAGLWFVCGEVHTRRAFEAGSTLLSLEGLLPLELDHSRADETIGISDASLEPRRYRATPLGAIRGPARLRESAAENDQLWQRLPGPRFVYPVGEVTPGAEVLCEVQAADPFDAQPVLATARVGGGRVLLSASDETNRWLGAAPELHDTFWLRGLRLLIESKVDGSSERVQLLADRSELSLGERIEFQVLGPSERLDGLELEVTDVDGTSSRIPISQTDASSGDGSSDRRTLTFRPRRLGRLRATLRSSEDLLTLPDLTFEVRPVDLESPGPSLVDEFFELADRDDTTVVGDLRQLDDALGSIPSASRSETLRAGRSAWDGPLTLWLLAGLLTIEWTLRKRWDLL